MQFGYQLQLPLQFGINTENIMPNIQLNMSVLKSELCCDTKNIGEYMNKHLYIFN
jgi:hypothetical protein